MIQIGDKIISTELFNEQFHCHLDICHGNCCVFGDSGAPLEDREAEILEKYFPSIQDFLTEKGRETIKSKGTWIIDDDGDKVTPLIHGEECAYTFFEGEIAFCGIEKAWEEGKISFQKPISCHLYPIRVSKVGQMTALNYHRWPICDPARKLGKKKNLPVFRFLKDSIVRAWGIDFYNELEVVYKEWKNR
ncbi:MAG: DUF3109 family protein [Bacteroidales bacterium]